MSLAGQLSTVCIIINKLHDSLRLLNLHAVYSKAESSNTWYLL
jgi:hypothetical protein